MSNTLLELKDVHAHYGKIKVLRGVNIKVKEGQIVALIGPNGAGKSTVLKSIFGLVPKVTGFILYDGKSILNNKPSEMINLGIGFVPQGRCVFPNLTVKENLELGAYILKGDLTKDLISVYQSFPILKHKENTRACLLSGGEQQMLAIGRALITKPKLVLLDEPSLGLAPKVSDFIFDKIQKLKTTFLIVEQNAHKALKIADHAYVLDLGKEQFEGTGKSLLKDKRVNKLYLGG